MKMILYSLFVFVGALVLSFESFALGNGGFGHGNGGDMCELRFKTVRDDLVSWIGRGGAAALRLPNEISYDKYVSEMLTKSESAQVSCVEDKVMIGEAEKTCINFAEADGTLRIVCNSDRFLKTADADQYVLVHHEYAGLAGFEVNVGESSSYFISDQITGFLENQIVKKLVVKPAPGTGMDPFDPASCTGPAMTKADAAKYFDRSGVKAGDAIDIATFALSTRERWCNTKTGCGGWNKIRNQVRHADVLRTSKFMVIPNGGVLTLNSNDLELTSSDRGLDGQGLHLECGNVGEAKLTCSVTALPSLDILGEATGTVAAHCARFTYRQQSFKVDQAFLDETGISHHNPVTQGDVWIERESAFLSQF